MISFSYVFAYCTERLTLAPIRQEYFLNSLARNTKKVNNPIERQPNHVNKTGEKNMQPAKSQLNIRINPVCMELIKLERKSLVGCNSDGEAVESLILRASTSPEANQILKQAFARNPFFTATQRAWNAEDISSPTHPPTETETFPDVRPEPGDQVGDLARRYAAATAKTPKAPPTAAPATNERQIKPKKSQT